MDALVAAVMDRRLAELFACWRDTATDSDPLDVFAAHRDYLVVIELTGARCFYLHYGRTLAGAFGNDLTGQDIDYLPPDILPRDRRGMLEFEYGFANRVQRPVWRSYTAEFAGGPGTWQRLVLPFGPDRLVVGVVQPAAAEVKTSEQALLQLVINRVPVVLSPDGGVADLALTLKDYSDSRLQAAEMELLATRDPLTGVGNLRHFKHLASLELDHARRMGRPMAVLMLDIDRFKSINDRWGHAAGDEALRRIAAVSRNGLREPDILGRLGGEEFAVALPNTGLDGARIIAERLRALIAEQVMESPSGDRFTMTASIGVAAHAAAHPTDLVADDIDTLLGRADAALYRAKAAGRNRVVAEGDQEAAPVSS